MPTHPSGRMANTRSHAVLTPRMAREMSINYAADLQMEIAYKVDDGDVQVRPWRWAVGGGMFTAWRRVLESSVGPRVVKRWIRRVPQPGCFL